MTSKKLPGLAAFERTKNETHQPLQQNEAEKTQGQLSVRNVTIAFKRRHQKVTAVENVNLDIKPGEFVALLGASGCGKSTLLNAIAGIIRPTEGSIWIDNQQVFEPNPACGVVFQHHSLFPWMTVIQNVSFGPKMLGFQASRSELENVSVEVTPTIKQTLEDWAKFSYETGIIKKEVAWNWK